ncbi:SPASM domain-containing protein [Candidatus Synechococcus calcipolaris G9]|uniref:SPASM domain-containing protein n=2 Tax=Synechococcus TaxID=1129 RepID=A0ABT6EUM7_9SYNE|nr:SPASM domain-containing protein [Candidatus Synechococcus calcipolaris G9]
MPEERARGFMDRETFDISVSQAESMGITDVRLYATAEPTLHPQFAEYVSILKDKNFFVTVSTNASMLYKHFEVLSRVDYLQYSIEGWDKESYEKFRYPLKFDIVKRNIEEFWNYIRDHSQRPLINCNLLATQSVNIDEFFACWADFVDQISISPLMTTTRYDTKSGKFISELNSDIQTDYYDHERDLTRFCTYPFTYITVAFDGKLALCCADFSAEINLGYISDGIENWKNNQLMKKIRHQFSPFGKKDMCAGCNFFLRPTQSTISALSEQVEKLPVHYKSKAKLAY